MFIIFTTDQHNRKIGIKALFTYIKSFLPIKKGKELFDTLKTKISLKQIESQKLIGKRVRIKKILAFSSIENIEKIGGFLAITNRLLKFISQITKNYFMKSIIVEEFYELNTIALISIIAKKVYLKIDNKYVLISDNKNIFIWLLKLIISIPLAIFLLLVCILVTILKILLIKPFHFGYGLDYKLLLSKE